MSDDQSPTGSRSFSLGLAPATTAIDPVCGMTVDPDTARGGSHTHAGTTYYFCAESCRRKFAADPQRYLAGERESMRPGSPATPPPHHPATRYICPMDPDVVSDRPGPCPKCGMALEPRTVLADDGPSPELRDMTRRFWVSLVLGLPLFALAMGELLFGRLPAEYQTAAAWLQAVLATGVVFYGGAPFFARAWASVVNRSPNMFTLIALGVGTAYLYSLAALLVPEAFPPGFRHHGAVMPYFESAAAIIVLV